MNYKWQFFTITRTHFSILRSL